MTETYCKLTHEMMRATHWTSRTTGEQFKLTDGQKIMWVWMESRYGFFHSTGKAWFDNQEDIAAATGCDLSTVKRFIAKLAQHGYIEVERQKGRGFIRSNKYEILAPLQVHVSKASTSSSGVNGGAVAPVLRVGLDAPVIASQELTGELIPVFEDIPLAAYSNDRQQTAVIVHKRLSMFGDELDGEVQDVVPVLGQDRTATHDVDYPCDPLPW